MVWNDILKDICKFCISGAVVGLESGLSFTTSDNGLYLNGTETGNLSIFIKNIKSSQNDTIVISNTECKVTSYSEKDSLVFLKSEDGKELIIGITKFILLIGLLPLEAEERNKALLGFTLIHQDLQSRGL